MHTKTRKTRTTLTNTRDYDIQSTSNKGKYLGGKANELENAAESLQSAAQSADEVNTKAGELATKAQTLSEAAGQINGGELDALQEKATALASAAGTKGCSGGGLAKATEALQSTPTDHTNAIAVIVAFSRVKEAYHELATQQKYKEIKQKLTAGSSQGVGSPEEKVNKVDDAWTQVNKHFQALCKALIKHYADQVDTKATALQRSANTADAQIFKDADNSTIEISTSGSTKTITITNLPHINDTFKPRQYKFFSIIIPSIISLWLNFLTSKAIQSYFTDRKLKTEAGTEATGNTLRKLAETLHTAAKQLDTEVKKAGSAPDGNAAKVLRAKAGTNDQKEDPKYLRKLAKTLYEKAEALEIAAPTNATDGQTLQQKAGTDENDGLRQLAKELHTAAKALAEAVGSGVTGQAQARELKDAVGTEGTSGGNNLANALKELYEQGTSAPKKLPDLAKAVKDKYSKFDGSGVKQKFELVMAQADAYAKGITIKTNQYKNLLVAWTNFNNKYYKALSSPKYNTIVHTSIFTMLSDCSPKTEYVFHKDSDPRNGFGGWKQYKDHVAQGQGCDPNEPDVHAWIWHFFDILFVIKIILAIIFIYSLHYLATD